MSHLKVMVSQQTIQKWDSPSGSERNMNLPIDAARCLVKCS